MPDASQLALIAIVIVVVSLEIITRHLNRKALVKRMSFKIELGSKVRCKLTGYVGIVHGRTEWLYGCRRYTIQATELKDGKPVEPIGGDEDQFEVLDQAAPHVLKETGGPQKEPSRPATAKR